MKKKEEVIETTEETAVGYVLNLKIESQALKNQFLTGWNECEKQIRCDPPEAWERKESWQTKVYNPMQAKKSEVVDAYLGKMLFGQKRFFSIQGEEENDRAKDDYVMSIYDNILNKGRFHFHKDFVMQEGIDLGTSFLKMLVKSNKAGVDFIYRSVFNVWFDPACGYDFYKSKYVIDEYTNVDIADLIENCKGGNPLYKEEAVLKLLDHASASVSAKSVEDMVTIKGIDGTSDIVIHKDFLQVTLLEFWGKAKVYYETKNEAGEKIKLYKLEDRVITIAQNLVELRNDKNEYGFIPYFICRVKPRKYDTYGKGYILNSRGLQDLSNSMINLGFDSLKINSMDIIGIDTNAVSDLASIEYRPLAIWKFKTSPKAAMDRSRPNMSALLDIIRGITLLDNIDQDASGVTRHAQGTPQLGGGGGGKETLGEYESKLQMIDQRFLKVGRFIEFDFIEPILKALFKIITNPKLFTQEAADRILGLEDIKQPNAMTGKEMVIGKKQKLILSELGDEIDYDFKAVGMTQFMTKMETLQKLQGMLEKALSNPVLTMLTKVPDVWKRIWQSTDIADYQDLLKDDKAIEEIMNQIQGAEQGAEGMPGGAPGGMPPQAAQLPMGGM